MLRIKFGGLATLKRKNFPGEDARTPHIKSPQHPTQLRPWLLHQAIGLGAPQTIIRRPSPDQHNKSGHTGCSCGRLGASHWWKYLYPLHICNFETGILACVVHITSPSILLPDLRGRSGFSFFKSCFTHFFYLGGQRIWYLRGEYGGCEQPTSGIWPNHDSTGINSDLGNSSIWIKISDAEHVDRCVGVDQHAQWRFSLIASTDLWPHEMFTFLKMHASGASLIMITIARTLVWRWREQERPIFGFRPTFSNYRKDSLLTSSSSGRSLPPAQSTSVDLPESIAVSAPYRS